MSAQESPLPPMDQEVIAKLYADMLRIRRFEQEFERDIPSSMGHEAIAVGALSVIEPEDFVICAELWHPHFLSKGGTIAELLNCLHSQEEPGMMFDASRCFAGGGFSPQFITPLAAGFAAAQTSEHKANVIVCFLPSSTLSSGLFHEAMVLGRSWKLPMVVVVEPSLRGACQEECAIQLAALGAAHSLELDSVDGRDIFAVRAAVHSAATRSRESRCTTLIEARISTNIEEPHLPWKLDDPIEGLSKKLDGLGMGRVREKLEAEVDREIRKAAAKR